MKMDSKLKNWEPILKREQKRLDAIVNALEDNSRLCVVYGVEASY